MAELICYFNAVHYVIKSLCESKPMKKQQNDIVMIIKSLRKFSLLAPDRICKMFCKTKLSNIATRVIGKKIIDTKLLLVKKFMY